MVTFERVNGFAPPVLNPGGISILGTTQTVELERTWPIEEIIVNVFGTVGGTALTLVASPQTPEQVNNIAGILKRVRLSINDGVQPRNIVDYSGFGLLEHVSQSGYNLDRSTWEVIRRAGMATITSAPTFPASANFRLSYRVPLVHPLISSPLRERCMLPCHRFPQNPLLSLDFASASEMYSAGALSFAGAEIVLMRRTINSAIDAAIEKSGGYLASDLIEVPYTIGAGVSGEQRFEVQRPGSYLNLLLRQYKGGEIGRAHV